MIPPVSVSPPTSPAIAAPASDAATFDNLMALCVAVDAELDRKTRKVSQDHPSVAKRVEDAVVRYEGEMLHGKANGKGKLTFNNGRVYEGDCQNGLRHGKGKTTFKDGRVIEGD